MYTQRWRRGRESYRPQGEVINTSRYGVEVIDEDLAKRFVCEHHYSGSYPAAKFRVGLFRGLRIVGVAVFSQSSNDAQVAAYSNAHDGADLGRFILLDDVPGNGETWFLGRAFRLLRMKRPDLGAIVSYSDPVARTTSEGHVVKPGHIGQIYKAFNGRYVGRARAEPLILDAHGRAVSRRSLSKLRNGEVGEAYVYERLLAAGAPRRRRFESSVDYVKRALREGPFRRIPHPGNHVYCWALRKGVILKKPALDYPEAACTS